MLPYSISLHNGTAWSRQHNRRGAGFPEKEEHIDPNGYKNAIIDIPLRQSYQETFGSAIQEYNAKQTRSERRILDYLGKVKDEHKKDPSRKPHASYEMILTVGNRDHHPSVQKSEEIMRAWLDEFQKRNPNVVVFGAYFHADEPDAAPHMHIDYYFVKRNNKRGLSLQVSQNGALTEQGYTPTKIDGKFVTPQTQFISDSRELLRQISKEKGLYVDLESKASMGRKHMDTKLFKQTTKSKELDQEIKQKSAQLKELESEIGFQKRKASELKSKTSIMEEVVERLDKKAGSINDVLAENERLKEEIKQKDEEISFLKKSINVLQRGFDFAKKMLKKLSMQENGVKVNLWQLFKHKLREENGREEYAEFRSVRENIDLNEELKQHELDYMDGSRRDVPPTPRFAGLHMEQEPDDEEDFQPKRNQFDFDR